MAQLTQTYDLLDRWRAGDADALAALLQRDLAWIRARVHRELGDHLRRAGDTEDFVQEAALAVLREGPRFVLSSRAQFRALLARIVVNLLRGQHRRLHALKRAPENAQTPPRSVLDLDGPQSAAPPPEEAAALAEEKEWLRLALLLLDPKDQVVIDLHWEGLTDAEIGGRIGLAANAVRMRRSRAVAWLARRARQLKSGRVGEIVGDDA